MKITIETIREDVDTERLQRMFSEFESFNDWERRLLQAKLAQMNRGARALPPYAIRKFIQEETCQSRRT